MPSKVCSTPSSPADEPRPWRRPGRRGSIARGRSPRTACRFRSSRTVPCGASRTRPASVRRSSACPRPSSPSVSSRAVDAAPRRRRRRAARPSPPRPRPAAPGTPGRTRRDSARIDLRAGRARGCAADHHARQVDARRLQRSSGRGRQRRSGAAAREPAVRARAYAVRYGTCNPDVAITSTPSALAACRSAAVVASAPRSAYQSRSTTSPPSAQNSATKPAAASQPGYQSSATITARRQPRSRYA